jgi:hypothetical protein
MEQWLRLEQLGHHTMLVTPEGAIRDVDVRAGQLRYVAGIGTRIELLIDPSPSRCAAAMHAGITSLLFAAPRYQRPEWRPDAEHGMRPWSQISAELDKQAEEAATDSRVG